jgi:hypothetical protein
MATGDKKPDEEGVEKSPAPPKPDVRVSSHEDLGVHVSRDLRAQGPSARGWNSNMSKLNFSARALPRDEIVEDDPAPAAAVPPPPVVAVSTTSETAEPASSSIISKLAGFFRR